MARIVFYWLLIGSFWTQGVYAQTAPREFFRLAKFKFDHKEYKGALDFINQAITTDTVYMNAYLLRADINFNLGCYYSTIKDVNHAFALDEARARTLSEYYLLRGKAFLKVNERERAMKDLQQALSISTDNPEAHYQIANIVYENGNPREAMKEIDEAIKMKSDNGAYYAQRAVMRYNTYKPIAGSQAYESVLADINVAIALVPDKYEYYRFRNLIFKRDKTNNFDFLMNQCNQSIKMFPNHPEVYKERGLLYMNKFNYQHAVMDFSLAIELGDKDAENYRYRALCYHNLDQYDKAISDYSNSLRLLTNMLPEVDNKKEMEFVLAETHFQRGNSYLIKRRNTEACQDFLRSYNLGAKKGLNYYRKYCNIY